MDESGIEMNMDGSGRLGGYATCKRPSGHSPPLHHIDVGTQSAPMYVTVSVASMQCALNDDNTLSVGTLQTAVPGAAGLYEHITHSGMAVRRALRVDRHAGVIYPPADGWRKQEYFVSFCECAISASARTRSPTGTPLWSLLYGSEWRRRQHVLAIRTSNKTIS